MSQQNEIIDMAKEIAAQYIKAERFQTWTYDFMMQRLMELAALSAVAEREACARVAADYGPSRPIVSKNPSSQIVGRWEGEQAASAGIEAAIRARGNHAV